MDKPIVKVCNTCEQELPLTEFSLAHSKYARYRGSCKRCERDRLKNTQAYDACECGKTKKAESTHCLPCRNRRNMYDPKALKTCPSCKTKKCAEEFGWRMHTGLKRIRNKCKQCCKEESAKRRSTMTAEELRNRKRKAAVRSKEKAKQDDAYRLARHRAAVRNSCRTLGLADQQDEIAAKYDSTTVCEICGASPSETRLAVDHCHTTGKFRGFLCSNCNNGLGRFKDDIEVMSKAISYLKRKIDE